MRVLNIFLIRGKLTRSSFVVRRISKRRFNLNVYFLNKFRENDLMSVKLLICHGNDLSLEAMKQKSNFGKISGKWIVKVNSKILRMNSDPKMRVVTHMMALPLTPFFLAALSVTTLISGLLLFTFTIHFPEIFPKFDFLFYILVW